MSEMEDIIVRTRETGVTLTVDGDERIATETELRLIEEWNRTRRELVDLQRDSGAAQVRAVQGLADHAEVLGADPNEPLFSVNVLRAALTLPSKDSSDG